VRAFLRVLLSRRLAASAMALVALVLGLATLVPSGEDLDRLRQRRPRVAWALEGLQPAEVARSPVLLALVAYVALAVLASMVSRFQARRRAPPRPLERFVARRSVRVDAPPGEAEARARAALRSAGLGHGALAGRQGAGAFWGSMAFHAGILLALAGVAASGGGRFSGELVLAEGIPLDVVPEVFLRASATEPLLALRGMRLAVTDVAAVYERGVHLVDVSAVLHVERPRDAPERLFASVNLPVDLAGFQLTVHAYGFAPDLVATDRSGRVVADGRAALRVLPPGTEDALLLPDGGVLKLRLYPDHVVEQGADASRTSQPQNPVLAFRWYEAGALVAEGRVRRGEAAAVNGYRVAFDDLALWADFLVGRDPGLPWFAAGALLGILGLVARFARSEQAWQVALRAAGEGADVDVTISARYFPALLEERAERIAAALVRPG
jgi:cytochrome c biogenesis protein ResB